MVNGWQRRGRVGRNFPWRPMSQVSVPSLSVEQKPARERGWT